MLTGSVAINLHDGLNEAFLQPGSLSYSWIA